MLVAVRYSRYRSADHLQRKKSKRRNATLTFGSGVVDLLHLSSLRFIISDLSSGRGRWVFGSLVKVALLPLFRKHRFVSDFVHPRNGEPLFSIVLCDDRASRVIHDPDDEFLMGAAIVVW